MLFSYVFFQYIDFRCPMLREHSPRLHLAEEAVTPDLRTGALVRSSARTMVGTCSVDLNLWTALLCKLALLTIYS